MSSAAKVETSDCEKSQEEVAVSVCTIETKEVEAQLNLLKKETQEYTSRCAAEARNLMEDVERETRNLDIVEREADEILKTSKLKLQDAIKQTEEETQTCAYGLMAVIDSVSKHKEYVQTKIFEMKRDVSETAVAASDTHKSCLQSQFGFLSDANQQSETALQ